MFGAVTRWPWHPYSTRQMDGRPPGQKRIPDSAVQCSVVFIIEHCGALVLQDRIGQPAGWWMGSHPPTQMYLSVLKCSGGRASQQWTTAVHCHPPSPSLQGAKENLCRVQYISFSWVSWRLISRSLMGFWWDFLGCQALGISGPKISRELFFLLLEAKGLIGAKSVFGNLLGTSLPLQEDKDIER